MFLHFFNIQNKIKERENRRDKITEGTKFRRDRKKKEKKRIARQHKLNEGEERKVL